MSKELSALTALQSYLTSTLLLQPEQVIVNDWPDVDKLPKGLSISILPDRVEFEQSTTTTLQCSLAVKLYIIAKGGTLSELLTDAMDALADMTRAILTDATLGGAVLDTVVQAGDIYPAVPGQSRAVGIEVDLVINYERGAFLLPGDIVPGEYVFPIGD